MLDIFEENKKYIYTVFVLLFLIILVFIYYSLNNENIELLENNNSSCLQNKINNDFADKNNKVGILGKKDEITPEIKNYKDIKKPIILYSSVSAKNKYFIKLTTNKEIISQKSTVLYITITGEILDKNFTDIFSLSLDENYLYDLNNTTLEIINSETKNVSNCEGSFLNTILPEFSYHIEVDIKKDFANCYIKSQSEPRNNIKIDNNFINDLTFDKNIIIQNETLIDKKELRNGINQLK